ncbi:MAG: hypothetical protein IT249_14010 [Chitinophagaceae bacterium]|nr:hypothetical protein [Chitinophagaceae bacterium]
MKHIKFFLMPAMSLQFFAASAQTKVSENTPIQLPARYFELLESGVAIVEKRLETDPTASLVSLESQPGWTHFPNAILIPAVLYSKSHALNKHFGDQRMLELAKKIGDFLVKEQEQGNYSKRGDSDWDTYMWLEAYRILEPKLGEERKQRWKKVLLEELQLLEPKLLKRINYPWYNAPFIITSPNHYSIYASALLVAGHVFHKPEWIEMSTKVLHRFCVKEQAADGYWGEHSQAGPTTGYDFLTLTQIALYWEYSKDPAALAALRRSTDFHKYFTYPDGTPVETINDRNRFWGISMWGQFGFSNFADGRRYAAFLASHFPYNGDLSSYGGNMQSFGRIAQNVLYYHEGKTALIPQDKPNYAHAMKIPAGIRKTGPWVTTYSGIIAPGVSQNNFFLDRQANFSVFNEHTGLIISGANSKRQPELATFTEITPTGSIHMPVSSYFNMAETADTLALAYNVFFATLSVPKPSADQLKFTINTTYKLDSAVSFMNIQLMLIAGKKLETAAGRKIILRDEIIDWGDAELGGWIKHNGWTLMIPTGMHLSWPVLPFDPYKNRPEKELSRAIGRLYVPLKNEDQKFEFDIKVN